MVVFAVPEAVREYAPADAVGVCTQCLSVTAASDVPASQPDPAQVSEALPSDPDVAVTLLLAGSSMRSLALNRSAVEALLARVEEAGVDPRLVFERLMADPAVDPSVALVRRYRQLEQLRE